MHFEILDRIESIENIAIGNSIREIARLRTLYGPGRWRKLKGIATVRLASGNIRTAEIHWYEAHGVSRVGIKIKRFLD